MFKKFTLIITSIVALLVSGCETVMTKNEIEKNYSTDNIQQFIKQRYVSELFTKMESIGKKTSIDDYTNQLLSDHKSVIYPAFFTGMNDKFLYKPSREIRRFCSVKRGRLYLVRRYNFNFEGLKENPGEEYFNTLNSNLPKTVDVPDFNDPIFYKGGTYSIPVNKKDVALLSELNAYQVNNTAISKLYQQAIANNAFGLFKCVNKKNKLLWAISLKPIAYKSASNAGDLSQHVDTLYLLITPISK